MAKNTGEVAAFQEKLTSELTNWVGKENLHIHTRRNKQKDNVQQAIPGGTDVGRSTEDKLQKPRGASGSEARSARFSCDRCDEPIDGLRLKCEDCPNFDYCPGCYLSAKRIHPGHKFKPMVGTKEAEAGEHKFVEDPRFSAMRREEKPKPLLHLENDSSAPEYFCKSCSAVATILGVWHHKAWGDIQDIPRRHALWSIKETTERWTIRLSGLVEATTFGCAFCSYILEKLFGPHSGVGLAYRALRPWYLGGENADKRRAQVLDNAMHLLTLLANDRFVFSIEPITGVLEESKPWLDGIRFRGIKAYCDQSLVQKCFGARGEVRFDLQAFSPPNNPSSRNAKKTAPKPSPASPESLALAHTWLQECLTKHGSACSAEPESSNGAPTRPKRLVEIADEKRLRLVELPLDHRSPYCALSYQWGGKEGLRLSTDSLARLKDGFQIDDLPLTIADAVKVARSVDVGYLWVDALCILQDNAEDKAREISRMGSIYRNATLTIIAASTTSAQSGFLQSRADPHIGWWKSLIPIRYPVLDPRSSSEEGAPPVDENENTAGRDRHVTWGTMCFMDDMEALDYSISRDPVSHRGWCLQERLLSPRVLNYGRWPTWRCRKAKQTDGGFYLSSDPRLDKEDASAGLLLDVTRRSRAARLDHFDVHKLLSAWYRILGEYTKRELSDPADRLPGIGGIASIISRATGMEYVAGLWRDNLLHDLMWYADTREWLDRPPLKRAPTWSWASVAAAASYGHIDEYASPVATVLDCTTISATGASSEPPTVNATTTPPGELRLRGLARRISAAQVLPLFRSQDMRPSLPDGAVLTDLYRQMLEETDAGPQRKVAISDEDAAARLPERVYALLTFEHSRRVRDGEVQEGPFYSGLLLRPIVDDGDDYYYERMGSFKVEDASRLGVEGPGWEERTVWIR
ncbi:heterokaryon incompatibility protein-domain-containing protein [Xylariomycetidae sp. FL2044]|nr:heterokaryon incompatibility protein-domain-containing protein [Xylariomycetidae sp. FL2044]